MDGVSYLGEKNLSEFGLTAADEIPVKVVKTTSKIEYYVNGTLAYSCENANFNACAHFGFFGTSPTANSGLTGQYGAQYKIISVVMN